MPESFQVITFSGNPPRHQGHPEGTVYIRVATRHAIENLFTSVRNKKLLPQKEKRFKETAISAEKHIRATRSEVVELKMLLEQLDNDNYDPARHPNSHVAAKVLRRVNHDIPKSLNASLAFLDQLERIRDEIDEIGGDTFQEAMDELEEIHFSNIAVFESCGCEYPIDSEAVFVLTVD